MCFIRLVLFSYKSDFTCYVQFVRLFLAHSNSAINSCLYVTFCENYRHGVIKVLSQMRCLQVCFTTNYIFPRDTTDGKREVVFHEN